MTTATTDANLIEHLHVLENETAFRTCPEFGVVFVRGDDRVSWLNGQLTNDVRDIPPGNSVHALAVNVRGKIMAELYVADLGDALVLLAPRTAEATLLESFERYIIMEDVTLEPAPDMSVLYVDGPLSALPANSPSDPSSWINFKCAPLGRDSCVWIGDAPSVSALSAQLETKIPRIHETAYEVVRLRRAIPRFGVDYDDHNYPQEVGLKPLVSFNKGCYLGQEVVCTLESRGKLSRHLCLLEGARNVQAQDIVTARTSNLADRTAVYASTETPTAEPAGSITSAVWDPEQAHCHLLAYVRRSHAVVGATLFAGGQPLTLTRIVGEADDVRANT